MNNQKATSYLKTARQWKYVVLQIHHKHSPEQSQLVCTYKT